MSRQRDLIASILDDHQVHLACRRHPEKPKVTLFTVRCRACGELRASETPLPPCKIMWDHQAEQLIDALELDP